jgi:hypothetical protein
VGLILGFGRGLDDASASALACQGVAQAVAVRDCGAAVVGVDLHGDEQTFPSPQPFVEAFRLDLLYLSMSFLWWQAVAEIIGVTASTALRMHSRCTWRPREGSRNVHHTAIRRALSPSRPCGSVTAGAHADPEELHRSGTTS